MFLCRWGEPGVRVKETSLKRLFFDPREARLGVCSRDDSLEDLNDDKADVRCVCEPCQTL